MDNIIQFPNGYRYISDMDLFKAAVDCTKEMLERKEMIILYQFIDEISAEVFISQDDFEQKYKEIGWNDFIDILNSEIIYLLRQNFEEGVDKDTDLGLKSFLNEKKVPEESQKEIIKLKLDKGRYVNLHLGGIKERNRYNLKNRSFLKRLSDMDYELSRTIDEEEIIYTTIRMSVSSELQDKSVSSILNGMFNQDKESITFICDKSDIEYLIQKLEKIKQML